MMNSCDRKHFRVLRLRVLIALAPLLLPAAALAQQPAPPDKSVGEVAPRGQRPVRDIKYGDWQKYCFKVPSSNMVCRTSISGTWDTGRTAVRADLIEREGENKARLQLFLPVGLYLQAGVKLAVDGGKRRNVPYVWCLTNTCIASAVADPALIHEMEKGRKLELEVVDASVQSVSTTLPLGQFAPVRAGAATKTIQQDIDE
jgi:invasion protein IalB